MKYMGSTTSYCSSYLFKNLCSGTLFLKNKYVVIQSYVIQDHVNLGLCILIMWLACISGSILIMCPHRLVKWCLCFFFSYDKIVVR